MLSGGTASSMGTLNKARQDHRLSWNSFSECEQRTSCLIPIPSPAFSRCIELVGLKVFDEMPETNSVSWATMVSGYPIQRPAVEAEIFKLMRLKDEKVNEYALTDPELLNTGRQIHCLRVKKWVIRIPLHGLRVCEFVGITPSEFTLVGVLNACSDIPAASSWLFVEIGIQIASMLVVRN
ncbi:hypothetical protein V6N13_049312 [Hibiscus sabdariffa]